MKMLSLITGRQRGLEVLVYLGEEGGCGEGVCVLGAGGVSRGDVMT